MRILIIGLVILALSVAGISTYLIQSFSTPEAIQALEEKAEPTKTQVLVANKSLAPGTILNSNNMEWRLWPEESVSEHYISVEKDDQKDEKFKELLDSKVRRQIQPGEPVLSSKLFKRDAPGFMAGMLGKGMRAISMPVDATSGVAGFVLPGDRVDILLVLKRAKDGVRKTSPKKKAQKAGAAIKPMIVLDSVAETILQDILVLAVDQVIGGVEGNALLAKTLTLQMTPKQVEIFKTGEAIGAISMALRDIDGGDPESVLRPGTFTTDVEASPFLTSLNNRLIAGADAKRAMEMAAKNKARRAARREAEEIAREEAEERAQRAAAERAAALRTGNQPPKKLIKARSSVKRKSRTGKQVIQIYRGKAAKTEEIKVK